MKILFVYSLWDVLTPAKPLKSQEQIQFGISYLSAVLKPHGHQTKLLVLSSNVGNPEDRLNRCLAEFQPQVICFSVVFSEYEFLAQVAGFCKRNYPEIYLLAGGPQVSLNPEECLQAPFDALCIGEGEAPLLELLAQLSAGKAPAGIANLWLRQGEQVAKNPTRPYLEDLDSLPFPDRELWQEWIADEEGSRISVLLGRGCPFQCTYCCNHALKKLAAGKYVRFRKPEKIIEEIRELAARWPEKDNLYLEVETIGLDQEWALELFAKLAELNRELPRPRAYGVNLRITPGLDCEALFAAMQRANFTTVNIGLESGSERVRREILLRNYANEDIIKTVETARRHGIKVAFFNLIGIPGETKADFLETIRINQLCQPELHALSIVFPYPGTRLHEVAREMGVLPANLDGRAERSRVVMDLPGFSRKEIRHYYTWFDYYVFKGHRPMFKILRAVMLAKLKSYPRLLTWAKRAAKLPLVSWLRDRTRWTG
ncbi:MAG: B12-binding domain-containing radical SAM protein [Planctomycetes bacterium]|nr:B12-binding domain-containing radical SAM protein [Planctomycetota bacterium]